MDMPFVYNDGGREAAGFKGKASDCVVRAIAIATLKPYRDVYDALNELGKQERTGKRKKGRSTARNGVYRTTIDKYMKSLGWKWTPCMKIGSGCKVHLKADELPLGPLIVSVSKHVVAVVNRVVHDIYEDSRGGTRCVYGYWSKQ